MNPIQSNSSVSGMGRTLSNEPVRNSQIDNWLNNIRSAVSENESLAGELRGRLESVLRQEPETACDNSKQTPEEYLVSHADALRSLEKRLTATNGLLRGILSRCEL